MSKDRSPRRRPEPKQRKIVSESRIRWLLLLAALPIGIVALATYFVMRSSWLDVQTVQVQGAENLDAAALVDISGLAGQNMLSLSLDEARNRLLEVPQIRDVSFSREWPDQVNMRVHERVPVAFWSVNGRDYAVDSEGVVLGAGAPSGPAPRILEVDSRRILGPGDRVQPDAIAFAERILDESPAFLGQNLNVLEYSATIGVTAVFSGGMRVTFGDQRSYEYKVAVLTTLLDQLNAQGRKPNAVDLRFGERVTYE